VFDYDYHRLKRWLLKMSFNSARIHAAKDEFVFPPLLPYILGKSESLGRSVQLYVQLSYPGEIPEGLLGRVLIKSTTLIDVRLRPLCADPVPCQARG
jgi:hypothetical protein